MKEAQEYLTNDKSLAYFENQCTSRFINAAAGHLTNVTS